MNRKVKVGNLFTGFPFMSEDERKTFPFVYTKEMEENEGKIGEIIKEDTKNNRVLVCFENGAYWYPERSVHDIYPPLHLLKVDGHFMYFDSPLKESDVITYDKIKGLQLILDDDTVKTPIGHRVIARTREIPEEMKERGVEYFRIGFCYAPCREKFEGYED